MQQMKFGFWRRFFRASVCLVFTQKWNTPRAFALHTCPQDHCKCALRVDTNLWLYLSKILCCCSVATETGYEHTFVVCTSEWFGWQQRQEYNEEIHLKPPEIEHLCFALTTIRTRGFFLPNATTMEDAVTLEPRSADSRHRESKGNKDMEVLSNGSVQQTFRRVLHLHLLVVFDFVECVWNNTNAC